MCGALTANELAVTALAFVGEQELRLPRERLVGS